MKKTLNIFALFALLLVTASPVSRAATFFADYFTNSSTLNQPPAVPTLNSASYQTFMGITNAGSIPGLTSGKLTLACPITSSVLGEALARFTTTPVALSEVGDYIEVKVIFVNTSNVLSTAAGVVENANASINIGLFNSGSVNPNQGQFAISTLNGLPGILTGGTEDWLGYIGRIGFTGNNAIITRPTQTPATTANSRNQDLLFSNASSSQAFGEPSGSTVNGPAGNTSLVQGATNTLYLKITLAAPGNLTVSNALFAGVGIGGAPVYGQERTNLTGTTFLTGGFDALAVGWRNSNSTGSQGSAIDILGIEVTGQSTVVTSPPDIVTQPVPVSVPVGGSAAFWVTAQGFNMTYQWHRYGTNLVNTGNISGATSDTLVISPVSAGDVASGANGYYVTITGTGNYSTNSTTNALSLRTATPLTWSPTSGNVWDLNTTANWTADGVTPTVFNFGDPVTFNDNASLRIINLTGKYLSAASVTVDSSDGGAPYNFFNTSTGSFAGPGQLIYQGANQLTIGNANTYTGGTIISNANAFLLLQNYNGLGSGPVTLAKAGGRMEIVTSGSASLGIQGNVIVQDDFAIQFDGTGAFGTVFLGNLSGTAGKTLTLTPASLTTTNRIRVYGTSTVLDANLAIDGPATSEANYYGTGFAPYNPSGSQIYNGVISGNAGLIQRGAGLAVFAGQNTFTGGTTPSTGTLGIGADSTPTVGTVVSGPFGTGPVFLNPEAPNLTGNGSVLAFGGARTIANPLQYASGTNNQTLVIAGTNDLTFSGAYTLNGNDGATAFTNRVLQVDNTGLTTISGIVSGNGFGITKTGTGTLVLNRIETYTGPTAVSNGTLRVDGQIGVAGVGNVTVATNGILGGNGVVDGPVTVFRGGAIAPGSSIGTLSLDQGLTLSGNLNIEVNNGTSDRVVVSGTLTNAGTGTVTVTNLGSTLQAGNTFTLFNKPLTNGDAMTITGGSVIWTNKLAVDGTISVVTAISTTPTNISYVVTGNTLTLSWPQDHLTWTLQSNIVGVASTSNWFPVPNSASTTQVAITVNPARSNVFYRLIAP